MNIPLSRHPFPYKKVAVIFLLVVIVLVVPGAVFYGQLGAVQPGSTEEELFIVKNGATPAEIAEDLQKAGLIKNAQTFIIYGRLTNKLDKFKAGQYLLKASLTVPELTDLLVKGKVAVISFTIPEGYTLRQIADVLVKQGITTSEEYWRVVKDEPFDFTFLQGLPNNDKRLEGYLFPDTYIIPKGMETHQVIEVMLKRFDQVYKTLPPNQTDLNMRDQVILASLVEGESKVDEDRPLIASVFLNRLKIGMKLDCDATIQYIFDKRKDRVLYKDLETDSPYNTYLYKGLPPGPIGSPGKASLTAALVPESKNKYLYFVAKKDGSGKHVFAETLQEHNRNKQKLGY